MGNQFMVKAEPIFAASDEGYYIEMVKKCEEKRKLYIEAASNRGKTKTSMTAPPARMSHELEKENAEQAPSNQKSFVGVSSSLRNNSFGVPSLPDMSKQVAGGAKKKTEFKDIIVPVSPIETLEPEKKFYNEVPVPKIKGILFWSRPRLPQVVKNYTLRKGDMVRTLQSKNAKNGYAERKEG